MVSDEYAEDQQYEERSTATYQDMADTMLGVDSVEEGQPDFIKNMTGDF